MGKDVFIIGMDLGASKTAVVASNGRREILPSVVGWPRDRLAQTWLGRSVLFGREVMENRLALRMVRPFDKGLLKYGDPTAAGVSGERLEEHKEAARLLIRHAVSKVQPPEGARIHGVLGVPSRASLANHQCLIEAAESVFTSVVVVPEPFAVAYGVDRLQDTLVVDIGAGTTDICPLTGTFPLEQDQVTIPLGGDAIDEEFHRGVCEMYPEVRLSINTAREIKERDGFVHDRGDRVVVCLPTDDAPQCFDVTEPLRRACRMILQPVVEGVRTVLRRVDPEFRARMLGNVLLSGGGSQILGIERSLETGLEPLPGVRVGKVHDWLFAGATGAFGLAMSMTTEQWELIHRVESVENTGSPPSRAEFLHGAPVSAGH